MGDAKLRDWEGRTCGVRELRGIDNCNRVVGRRKGRSRKNPGLKLIWVHETSRRFANLGSTDRNDPQPERLRRRYRRYLLTVLRGSEKLWNRWNFGPSVRLKPRWTYSRNRVAEHSQYREAIHREPASYPQASPIERRSRNRQLKSKPG
jgi:hypothetical protein